MALWTLTRPTSGVCWCYPYLGAIRTNCVPTVGIRGTSPTLDVAALALPIFSRSYCPPSSIAPAYPWDLLLWSALAYQWDLLLGSGITSLRNTFACVLTLRPSILRVIAPIITTVVERLSF